MGGEGGAGEIHLNFSFIKDVNVEVKYYIEMSKCSSIVIVSFERWLNSERHDGWYR